jgi:hypothetical protein
LGSQHTHSSWKDSIQRNNTHFFVCIYLIPEQLQIILLFPLPSRSAAQEKFVPGLALFIDMAAPKKDVLLFDEEEAGTPTAPDPQLQQKINK